jgi:HEAT repeat protein
MLSQLRIFIPALTLVAAAAAQTVDTEVKAELAATIKAEVDAKVASTVATTHYAYAQAAARAEASAKVNVNIARLDGNYSHAMRALDQRKWEEALAILKKVTGDRADAALYWRAYAQAKLGRRDEALATLATLKGQTASRWLNDAAALEVEVRQASGQTVSPDSESDDDTRLMALHGVMANDPDRALPILQKMISGAQSPRVKERAMFVLAQSDSPKSREVLIQFAKGAANPDLQRQAVRALGIRGAKDNQPILAEIYQSSPDKAVKREVLMALANSGDKERLVNLVRTEKDPGLRGDAIRQVGVMGDQKFLTDLYAAESDAGVKTQIAYALMTARAMQPLIDIAGSEKDPAVRRKVIQLLGTFPAEKTGPALLQLYAKESDKSVRTQVLMGLQMQGNAKSLIELARGETDPELKRAAIRHLSSMRSKEASDFLLEFLSKDSAAK